MPWNSVSRYPSLFLFLFGGMPLLTGASMEAKNDPGNPLFLTPLINSGEIIQARESALVKDFFPVKSYSGFITINESQNSNMFFWYFPSEVRIQLIHGIIF